ncbi:MAG: glutathione S-transferase family protein [Pseudomonadota bacterium]
MALKLYAAPRTRSLRVAWLLEELGVDYEVILAEFQPTQTEFFIQETPSGKFPTIDDDGFVLFESGAIVEYLLEKYPGSELMPPAGSREKGECLQWMYFAEATAFSPIGIVVWLTLYRDDADRHAALVEDARQRARTALELLERRMAAREWLVGGRFTAADIMLGFTLLAARSLGLVAEDGVLGRYLERLEARPAYQRALLETGGIDRGEIADT